MPLTTSSLPHLSRQKPPVETFQTPFELQQMLAIYDHLQPERTLEVGSWQGGTLWHFIQHPATKKVVAVDDVMRHADDWREWAHDARTDLVLFHGPSQDVGIVDKVREHGPYDFVFIDGDHTYDGVAADWDNYGPMVAPDGVIVFHDIISRPGYGVDRVWGEVKALPGCRWVEIGQEAIEAGFEGRCGVGVAWLK